MCFKEVLKCRFNLYLFGNNLYSAEVSRRIRAHKYINECITLQRTLKINRETLAYNLLITAPAEPVCEGKRGKLSDLLSK